MEIWLHTSWRDSNYNKVTLVWKANCIRQPKRQPPSSSYNHNTPTTLRISVRESLQMHFKVAVVQAGGSPRYSKDCQCIMVVMKLGSCILGCLMQLVLHTKVNPS